LLLIIWPLSENGSILFALIGLINDKHMKIVTKISIFFFIITPYNKHYFLTIQFQSKKSLHFLLLGDNSQEYPSFVDVFP